MPLKYIYLLVECDDENIKDNIEVVPVGWTSDVNKETKTINDITLMGFVICKTD